MLFKIVIPVYKSHLTENEILSFNSVLRFYNTSHISLITPNRIDLPDIFKNVEQQKFDDAYFKNIMGYNSLLLSEKLYERFNNIDYILIHQLDAFMFKKELEHWCSKGYDYIGAPWLTSANILYKIFKSKKLKKRQPIFNKVGNGGFSLRKIETFLNFFKTNADVIEEFKNHELYGIEDVFWSLIAPKHQEFKIPDYNEAAKFCIDRKPELGLKLNNGQLPFGCHGFEKSKTKPFWQKHIKDLK